MKEAALVYLRAVRKRLRCRRVMRNQIMARIQKDAIEPFLEEHPNADHAALCAAFGTPEELAAMMQAEVPEEEVTAWKRARWMWRMIVCVLVVLVISIGVYAISCRTQPIYFKDEITVFSAESSEISNKKTVFTSQMHFTSQL